MYTLKINCEYPYLDNIITATITKVNRTWTIHVNSTWIEQNFYGTIEQAKDLAEKKIIETLEGYIRTCKDFISEFKKQ